MNRTLLLFRYAALYRTSIYLEIEKEFNADFSFSAKISIPIKKMDYSILQRCKLFGEEKEIIGGFHYMSSFQDINIDQYNNIIMAGDSKDLTVWKVLIINKFKKNKQKTILWSHGWYGREGYLKSIIKKKLFNLADEILLYGEYARKLMIANGFDSSKLHVIYNSLDYDNQLAIREKMKISDIYIKKFNNNSKNLIFIGRLTREKKLNLLIEAILILKRNGFETNLTLIGDGNEGEDLKSLANKYSLEKNIWFYGASYNEDFLSELIYNADICVSPGNVGLTAIHSMTYGTPVVTHKDFTHQGPEFEAIIEGKTGSYFNFNEAVSLANTIYNWFNKIIDREQIRENCYEIIDKKYNPHYQIEVLRQIL